MLIKPTKITGYKIIAIKNAIMYDVDTKEPLLEIKEGFLTTDELYSIYDRGKFPIIRVEDERKIWFSSQFLI